MNNQMDNRPDRNRPNRNNPGNQGPNKNPPVYSGFFDLSADFTGMPELCNRYDERQVQ